VRKTHPASLKFKVALASITGQPITDVCKQFEIAESLVHKWKKHLKDNGVSLFQDARSQNTNNHDTEIEKLHQIIGKLTTEMEFLKKVLGA